MNSTNQTNETTIPTPADAPATADANGASSAEPVTEPTAVEHTEEEKEALTWRSKGNDHYAAGELDEALACYTKGIALAPHMIVFHCNISGVHFARKQWWDCIDACKRVFRADRDNSKDTDETRRLLAKTLERMGRAYGHLKHLKKQEECFFSSCNFRASEALFAKAGRLMDRQHKVSALVQVANKLASLNSQHTLKAFQKARKAAQDNGDLGVELSILQRIGGLEHKERKYADAKATFERALEIAEHLREYDDQGRACTGLGYACGALGETDRAVAMHERAVDIAQTHATDGHQVRMLNNLRGTYLRVGRVADATAVARKAVVLADAQTQPQLVQLAYTQLGAVLAQVGDKSGAEAAWRSALAAAEAREDTTGMGTLQGKLASLHAQ